MSISVSRQRLILATAGLFCTAAHAQTRPNIVHIFADDLGWGSVQFNNPSTYLQTPNLNALAAGGLTLDRAYASTVCSPSRANLYTGFHNGHAANDRNGNINQGLRAQDITTAEMIGTAGYQSAIFGKWGWGASGQRTIGTTPDDLPAITDAESLPTNQGFAQFSGILNHSAAHDYYYSWVWQSSGLNATTNAIANNTGAGGGPAYSHDLTTLSSEAYVRDNANGVNPFYMQVCYTIPHFDLGAIDTTPALVNLAGQTIAPAGRGPFAGSALNDIQEQYSAMVARMDASIGSLVARLDDPNGDGNKADSVLANTLILFTSDNGTTGEGGFGDANATDPRISGGQKGGKRDLYQGGIREPALAYWKGTIAPGTHTSLSTDLADVSATAAELAGVLPRVGIDGVSIAPTLTGQGTQRDRGALLFENFENSTFGFANADWTVIRGDQKLIKFRDGSYELYNLATDPGEATPLAFTVPANAALRDELIGIALAEGAGQTDSYAVSYRDWTGAGNTDVFNAANWTVPAEPATAVGGVDETWSASLIHTGATARTANINSNVQTLGFEIGGTLSTMTARVARSASLGGRNEVRVRDRGRIVLDQATLSSNRWIDIYAGGAISGSGTIVGAIHNAGRIEVGLARGLAAPATPPTVNTGVVSAIVFNFAGIQDAPVGAASTLNVNAVVASPFFFGPGTQERANNFNDQGNELNVQGWTIGGDLATAITNDDYVGFALAPIAGVEMKLSTVRFGLWRNGTGAPPDYAILTSLGGFTSSSALGTFNVTGTGSTAQATLTATYTGTTWVRSPLDVRVYGWNATGVNSHTHFNAVSMDASFRSIPGSTIVIDSTGTLTINGSYEHAAGSELAIDLGGTSVSDPNNPQYDRLLISGAATLAGAMSVQFVDGFVGLPGMTFDVVGYTSHTGTFSAITNQTPYAGLSFTPTYLATGVRLSLSAIAGDANLDGAVSFDDLLALAQNYGSSGTNWLKGDFNADQNTGFDDLLALAQNYGTSGTFANDWALAQALTPEPSVLAAIGLVMPMLRKRKA